MKVFLLAVSFAFVALATVNGMPRKDPEYAMVPDSDGNFNLIDINEEPEIDNLFNAATDVIFTLFSAANPQGERLLFGNEDSIRSSSFNAAHPTRFVIHGWNNDGYADVNVVIRQAYAARGNFNVIVVDWGAGANSNYLSSRNRVSAVGSVTAQLIVMMSRVSDGALHPRDITVVGHSLGAHAAGFVGKGLLGEMRLGAIVAMDAAFPLFSYDSPNQRVARGDAIYVESIHTNAGLLGFDMPLGVASFYPNWGRSQPGCGIDIAGSCAHSRAFEFFAESITTNTGFWARQCANFDEINSEICTASGVDRKMGGEPVENLANGIYFLSTNRNAPFAQGI